ncbi:MAG TPA: S41 family peptidase [Thermoanaerobaculia bacterium]
MAALSWKRLLVAVLGVVPLAGACLPPPRAVAPPPEAASGRWDLDFDLPESVPWSRVKMPFDLAFDATGALRAVALGGPGISLAEGRLLGSSLSASGRSIFGPMRLVAELRGDALEGRWTAGSASGRVAGCRVRAERTPADRLAIFDAAWSEIDRQFYDPRLRGVDWAAMREKYRPRVAAASSDGPMLVAVRQMLDQLHTSHLGFFALPPEAALVARPGTAGGEPASRPLVWSRPTADVALLRIARFAEGREAVKLVDDAFADLAGMPWMILDLRGNEGGTLDMAMRLGDYLFPEPRVVGLLSTRLGLRTYGVAAIGDLRADRLPVYDGTSADELRQALREKGAVALRTGGRGRPRWAGRLVILADERTASTAEAFVAMAKEAGVAAALVGRKTAGALLSARDVQLLGTPWTLRYPEADFRTAGGLEIEGHGIAPDLEVAKGAGADAEIVRVLAFIRGQPAAAAAPRW